MDDEKRKKTRVQFKTQVSLKTENYGIVGDSDSENISMKGIFVNTEEKIPLDTLCDVEITLMGKSSRLSLAVKGVVARQGESGLGIEFKSIDIDSYFHLKNIVMYNASDPGELGSETWSLK